MHITWSFYLFPTIRVYVVSVLHYCVTVQVFGGEMIPTDKTLSYKDLEKYKVSQIMWVHTQMYPYNKDTNGTEKDASLFQGLRYVQDCCWG